MLADALDVLLCVDTGSEDKTRLIGDKEEVHDIIYGLHTPHLSPQSHLPPLLHTTPVVPPYFYTTLETLGHPYIGGLFLGTHWNEEQGAKGYSLRPNQLADKVMFQFLPHLLI